MIRRASIASLTACTLALAACGTGAGGDSGAGDSGGAGDQVGVVVGFYPLQYLTERIGGNRVRVTNLTKPGVEPHDVELTPKDVAIVGEARLAVYEKTLQPAVDEAVTSQGVANVLEVSDAAQLTGVVDQPIIDVSDPGHADEHADQHASEPASPGSTETSTTEEHGHDHDHDHVEAGSIDPHFWLDPVRYTAVARAVAQKLEAVDPQGAETYRTNLAAVERDLTALDAEYRTGLKSCSNTTLVTSHAAFGYLAKRYGFTQAAISGLSPDQEPQPQRLAQVADYARKNGVKAIYAETLADPAVAETVAKETGARTMVLDPIEGLTRDGTDYLSVMRANLATLKAGQGCS